MRMAVYETIKLVIGHFGLLLSYLFSWSEFLCFLVCLFVCFVVCMALSNDSNDDGEVVNVCNAVKTWYFTAKPKIPTMN